MDYHHQEILSQHLGRTEDEVAANIERHLGRSLPPDFAARRDAFMRLRLALRSPRCPGFGMLSPSWKGRLANVCRLIGFHARMRLTLGLTGLRPLFDRRIYIAEEVTRGKPAPDLFLHAARNMDADPANCVVVEDSPSGVAAARSAGIPVIGFAALTPR